MNLHIPVTNPHTLPAYLRVPIFCVLLTGAPLVFTQATLGQTTQPLPTAAPSPTPLASPSPLPTATPAPDPTPVPSPTPVDVPTPLPTATPTGGDTPIITITPGLPSTAEMEAYNAARTPQVTVTLASITTPTTTPLRLSTQSGIYPAVTLSSAGSASGRSARSSSASSANPQPVALVALAYPASSPGQLVWVQMARPAGTLSATDGTGRVYSGDHGFFLTLGAAGTVTFTFQPPDFGGTYQILTRFDNVVTALPFLVPDTVP